MKKIKSKKYHKIVKKGKANKALKYFEQLRKDDHTGQTGDRRIRT